MAKGKTKSNDLGDLKEVVTDKSIQESKGLMQKLSMSKENIHRFMYKRPNWNIESSEISRLSNDIDKYLSNKNIKEILKNNNSDPNDSSETALFSQLIEQGNGETSILEDMYNENADTFTRYKDELLIFRNFPHMKEIITQLVNEMLAPDDYTKEIMYTVKKSDGTDIIGLSSSVKNNKVNKYIRDGITEMCVHGKSYIVVDKISDIMNTHLKRKKNDYNLNLSEGYHPYREMFFEGETRLRSSAYTEILSEKINVDAFIGDTNNTKNKTHLFGNDIELEDSEKTGIMGSYNRLLSKNEVLPIKIGDSIAGYLYVNPTKRTERLTNGGTVNRKLDDHSFEKRKKYKDKLAASIFKNLSLEFIDLNNEYKTEIATLLSDINVDDKVSYTFIPCDKIVELSTPDGASVFESAIPFAKVYIYLFYTKILLKCSREHDQRIYFIKNVTKNGNKNTNKSLQTSLKTLQFSRLNMSVLSDLNRSLMQRAGSTGDLIFCTNEGESSPFNVDVIEGQKIDMDLELFEKLERIIINSVGVPSSVTSFLLEDANFVKELSMDNARFLRTIVRLQNNIQSEVTEFMSMILKNDGVIDESEEIILTLPLSNALMTEVNSENIRGVLDVAESISELIISDEDDDADELRRLFKLDFMFKNTKFDRNEIEEMMRLVKLKLVADKVSKSEENTEDDDDGVNNRYI